jgi:hypothetical protein
MYPATVLRSDNDCSTNDEVELLLLGAPADDMAGERGNERPGQAESPAYNLGARWPKGSLPKRRYGRVGTEAIRDSRLCSRRGRAASD